ncbi:MAG: pentapeptide repeat-containing protein [Cyanobacteria bacterium J06638_28]
MNKRSAIEKNLKVLGLRIAFGLAVVGGISGGWSFFISGRDSPLQWWVSWLQDVATEMLGAAVTILLVELVIYQKRDEASRLDQERMRRRDQLADQLKQARSLERRQKILSRMKQQDLLAGAWLFEVDLQKADLQKCNCQETDLFEANLTAAILREADLTDTNLRRAKLRYADLSSANLEGADLSEADLRATNLSEAILQDADLSNAKFDQTTRLPNGELWTSSADLSQFTQLSEQGAKSQ